MKKIVIIVSGFAILACLFSSCKKMFGLSLYENYEYKSKTLDPQQGITAWEFLNKSRPDTLFNLMKLGIKYAGLEEEYKKPNRTYFFLTNAAISAKSSTTGLESSTTYFGRNLVNGKPGKAWQDYPVAQIRDLFQYHIAEGMHAHGNLTIDPVITQTLRADPSTNKVWINLQKDNRYLQLELNNFPKSAKIILPRTANLQMKENCVVHVLASYLEYVLLP